MKISKLKTTNQKRVKKLTKNVKPKNPNAPVGKPGKKASKKKKNGPPPPPAPTADEEIDYRDMFDDEDLNELLNSAANDSKFGKFSKSSNNQKPKQTSESLEDKYEREVLQNVDAEKAGKEIRHLLPVKTAEGKVEKRMIEENAVDSEDEGEEKARNKKRKTESESEEEESEELEKIDSLMEPENEPVSVAELFASRQELLESKKYSIGTLCRGLLENPEQNKHNFIPLFDFMTDKTPATFLTVRRLATASLMEVFKDLLPSYSINNAQQDGVKFKKDTLELQNFEATLLRNYRKYLQILEKMANGLRKKIFPSQEKSKREYEIQLGVLAVECMCNLLVAHPYFNFSTNIANFLVPLLDIKHENVRKTVALNISTIFKEDKRHELTLLIVRKINQHIKKCKHSVHIELLEVLLSLRIKEVNLEKDQEEEIKQKKLESHKKRVIAMSKKERKRDKRLKEIENELLETKAEENKKNRHKVLAEITSIVFTIYFRILKQEPNCKILSICLEGLAKFAHCINLEFYQDLVNVLNSLMDEANLPLKEKLNSISTVFTILSGHGSALNIDPRRFYGHLYKNLLNVNAWKTGGETLVILKILELALIGRIKSLPQPTLIAFVKRVATMSLFVEHHATLGLLAVVRTILQLGKGVQVLIDTDNEGSNGIYMADVEEPEYSNAHCTSLWEVVALQRHYHSTVRNYAKNIALNMPISGDGSIPLEISKLRAAELFEHFEPKNGAFKPAIPAPKIKIPEMRC